MIPIKKLFYTIPISLLQMKQKTGKIEKPK